MKKKVLSRKKSILDRAKPVSKMKTVLTALFYGRAGTGKTTISCSFPKPLLLIDICEEGTDSVSDLEEVDVIPITSWDEYEELYWELESGKTKYKTVVIDAIHSLQGFSIKKAKELNGKVDDDKTSQRDFGTASSLMTSWIYNYRDLKTKEINVIFLAHDRVHVVDDKDESTDGTIIPEVGPRLMPSVSSSLTGSVNIVGNTYINESFIKPKKAGGKVERKIEYCLRLGPNGYYNTKIRSPKKNKIPDFISDPSYEKLCRVIDGTINSKVKKVKKTSRRK